MQAEAAARAELDGRFWMRIEAGEANITLHTVARLAVALDADPGEFSAPDGHLRGERS